MVRAYWLSLPVSDVVKEVFVDGSRVVALTPLYM
jgi:hypothetical protein